MHERAQLPQLDIYQNFTLKMKIRRKTYNTLEGIAWWICVYNFKLISPKMAEIWDKTCKKQALFVISWLWRFSQFYILTNFDASKKCFEVIFHVLLRLSDLKTCIAALNHNFFCLTCFPGDLRWPWPLVWSQSTGNDTYKCQRHYPCRFIGFVSCLRLTSKLCSLMSEKLNILTLTWPVMSSATSRSNFRPCLESSRTGLSNGVWILEIGSVVWENHWTQGGGEPLQQYVWLARAHVDWLIGLWWSA